VNAREFYRNYHGYLVSHLDRVLPAIRRASGDGGSADRPIIFLVGDSSLDNKAWLPPAHMPAVNGYETVLDPPRAVGDVAHYLNVELQAAGDALPASFGVVNAAVEESTLAARGGGHLLPQDAFVRDNLRADDVLVVSVGGNDIALRPTPSTMASMAWLVHSSSDAAIDAGTALGLGHFVRMFKDDTAAYVAALCERTRPRLVVVCMIYYPHQSPSGSWADPALAALKYNDNPARLQRVMRRVYTDATCAVRVPGVRVVPCALFEALDPAPASEDYVARVEPSESGGRKMAAAFVRAIRDGYRQGGDGSDGKGETVATRGGDGHSVCTIQ
jgi:hypothetical protein